MSTGDGLGGAADKERKLTFARLTGAAQNRRIDDRDPRRDAVTQCTYITGRQGSAYDHTFKVRRAGSQRAGFEQDVFGFADVGRQDDKRCKPFGKPFRVVDRWLALAAVGQKAARVKAAITKPAQNRDRQAARTRDSDDTGQWTILSSRTNMLAQARSISSGVIWFGMPSKLQIATIWSIRNTGW